jgi:hypothetical protein
MEEDSKRVFAIMKKNHLPSIGLSNTKKKSVKVNWWSILMGGHYMEDEGAYYHEQVVSLRSKEVVENQVDERKEGQTEVPQEPHKEKEESTKTSSTLALILETL